MSVIAIIGILIAIAVLIIGSFKSVPIIILSLVATVVVIVTNGLGLWDGMMVWSESFASMSISYILIFIFSSIFAQFMGVSGAAATIGYKMVDWFGTKNVCIVVALMVGLLCYGGVSLYVVIYVVAPIMFIIFKEANLPRHLILIPFYMGHCTWEMVCLPGSPSVSNIIPTEYLGTTLMAAPILGILLAIFEFALQYVYWCYAVKRATRHGEGFTFPKNYDASRSAVRNPSDLPKTLPAFIPILIPLVIIIGANIMKLPIAKNSFALMTLAMVVGTILCVVLNYKKIRDEQGSKRMDISKKAMFEGGQNAVTSLASISVIVAFGTVVSKTAVFDTLMYWVANVWDIGIYWKATISTAIVSAIGAAGTTGLRLNMQYLADFYIASGANLDWIHRLACVASTCFDTLPHSCTIPLIFGILGETHKSGYKHAFAVSVIVPLIATIVGTTVCSIIGG